MNNSVQVSSKSKTKQTIIKDSDIIKTITQSHDSLGVDVTDIYVKLSELAKMQDEVLYFAKERFEKYATLSGKLSVFVFEMNSDENKGSLSPEEVNLLDHIRGILSRTSMIQTKINDDILKKLRKLNIETEELAKSNAELVELVMDLQDDSRVLSFMAKSMEDPEYDFYNNMLMGSLDILKHKKEIN